MVFQKRCTKKVNYYVLARASAWAKRLDRTQIVLGISIVITCVVSLPVSIWLKSEAHYLNYISSGAVVETTSFLVWLGLIVATAFVGVLIRLKTGKRFTLILVVLLVVITPLWLAGVTWCNIHFGTLIGSEIAEVTKCDNETPTICFVRIEGKTYTPFSPKTYKKGDEIDVTVREGFLGGVIVVVDRE